MRPMHSPSPSLLAVVVASLCACAASNGQRAQQAAAKPGVSTDPELGAFSVSLAVADLAASQAFYEALGFAVAGGVAEQNWLILRSGTTTIGLFQGMLPGNSLTFNPGWDSATGTLPTFVDVRELQRRFEARGLTLTMRADEATTGPAYFMLVDPDGNTILFDQHVPSPAR